MIQINPEYFNNAFRNGLIFGILAVLLGSIITSKCLRSKTLIYFMLPITVVPIIITIVGILTIFTTFVSHSTHDTTNIYQEYQVNGQIVMTSKTDGYFGKTNQSTIKLPDGVELDLSKTALNKIIDKSPDKQDLTQGSIIQYHTDKNGKLIIDQTIIHPIDTNNAANAQVTINPTQ